MRKLLAVLLTLALAVPAWASSTNIELMPLTTLGKAGTAAAGAQLLLCKGAEIPNGYHLAALGLKVQCPSNAADSLVQVGIEVYPMTSIVGAYVDSTGTGVLDVNGNALGIRYASIDSTAFAPIDMDDSNTKLDGFFCTNVDSFSLANSDLLAIKDSTYTTGATITDSLNAGAPGRHWWRQFVSSRVVYCEAQQSGTAAGPNTTFIGKGGIGALKTRFAAASGVRAVSNSFGSYPYPAPGGIQLRSNVAGQKSTAWFYMPMTDGYGGRIDVANVSAMILNKLTQAAVYQVALYAICMKN